jgi:quinol monooxygenase YgiN
MVTEIAEVTAQPGKAQELQAGLLRGLEVIRRGEGCHSAALLRGIEDPSRCILKIEWETLEHHTLTFRGGPLFAEYRSHITGLFVEPIVARHYETIEG